MRRVIVFGSFNMDLSIKCATLPAKGETIIGSEFFQAPGGKGANQAVAASKLGADTYMLGKVGKDVFGSMLVDSMKQANVNCEYLQHDGSRSGVAIIIRSEGDNRIICDHGANYEIDEALVAQSLRELARPGDIFLTQLECELQLTYSMLRLARQLGMITMLNPAPAIELPHDLYPQLDYIIVNQSECELLTGHFPRNHQECAVPLVELRQRGVNTPLITLGENGSAILTSSASTCSGLTEEVHHQHSLKVENVDTTAAGDAYIGALASGIARELPLTEAMQFATKAAALTITRLGAQQAIPHFDEVTEFLKD